MMTTSQLESPQPSPRPSLDEGGRLLQLQREPHSPFRPDEELHFDFPPVPLSASATQKTHFSHLPRDPGLRKMISVPEMRPGLPVNPNIHRQNSTGIPLPRPRVNSGDFGRERSGGQPLSKQVQRKMMEQDIAARECFETAPAGGDRLAKQKSMERGMRVGLPPTGQSPQGKRAVSNSERRPGRRTPPIIGPPPPGLRMPLAFNNIARERGFTTGSPSPGPQDFPPLPHPRHPSNPRGPYPSSSAPDLYGINSNENRHYHAPRRDPRNTPRSHPHPPHAPYSNNTSAMSSALSSTNTSPHSSAGPLGPPDEMRGSFRSALFTEEYRSDTQMSDRTEDSHTMTVDEAIGMYGSDTDEETIMREARAEENRRSKGDSVLGGVTSRHNSVSEEASARGSHGDSLMSGVSRQGSFEHEIERVRSKGDSVLGGEVSPMTRSKISEQEMALQRELDLQRKCEEGADYTQHPEQERRTGEEIGDKEERKTEQGKAEGQNDRRVEDQEDKVGSEDEVHPEPLATSEVLDTIPKSPAFGSHLAPEPPVVVNTPPKTPPKTPPVANVNPKDARDRYGFRKQTQYVTLAEYEEWNSRYEETLDRRRKKWEVLLKESGLSHGEGGPVRFPPKSAKVKRYIRKGIPPEWRGAAWFWYAGGQKVMNKNAGLYEELVNRGLDSPDSELIERDLHRTFPDNIKFKPDPPPGTKRLSRLQQQQLETPIVQQLRRVLVAFSRHVPRIGYCQSLNFLAGMLLLFMTEEKAFWMLWILTHHHLPGTHEVNLEGSSVDQWVLMMSVRESLPQIWSKIGGELDGSDFDPTSTKLPPITLCTSSWFMSGFIGSLPTESVLRVWDCLFYEGSKTLFRIALAVFKTGEPQIKAVSDPMEIFQVVQTIPRRIIDAGALIEACYRRRNGFGHISQETIDIRRQDRRDTFAAERAAIAKGGVRASKDDASMRTGLGHVNHGLGAHQGHDISRRFKKILVKT